MDNGRITPLTKKGAIAQVQVWKRYPVQFYRQLFQMAYAEGMEIKGVCVAGLPRAWVYNDGWTAEVETFAAGDDMRVIGKLIDAAWMAVRAIGYQRMLVQGEPVYVMEGYRREMPMPPGADRTDHTQQMGFVDWQDAMGGYERG